MSVSRTFQVGIRRTIVDAPDRAVTETTLDGCGPLPVVMRPVSAGIDACRWAEASRETIEQRLRSAGAVLFRDFPIDSVDAFEGFVRAVVGDLMEYTERSSPRHEETARIYTSTDYPADQRIFLHNEHSYSQHFPLKLFFCCLTPPASGGQTPIADTRRIYQRIEPGIRARFERQGWMYVRNFGDGFGLPWPTVFQTTEPSIVEAYCRRNDIQFEWKAGGRLRTCQVRPTTAVHPRTGEPTWFNHATFFHISTLPAAMREGLLDAFAEQDLPNNTYYGDGAQIEPETMDALRAAYEAETVRFDWRRGDVLLVDNMLASHGRESYTGARRILVAMADPQERQR